MRRFRILTLVGALLAAACGDDDTGAGGAATAGAGGAATSSSTTTSAATTGDTTTSVTSTSSAGGAGQGGAGQGGAGQGGAGQGGAGQGGAGQGGAGQGGAGQGGAGGAGGGPPLDGYGALSGSCGDIDAEDLISPDPEVLAGRIDFTDEPPITLDDVSALTPGGQEMIADGNLGGSSLWSEVFAFEVLARCEGATLLKSEGEILYDIQGKKTDILVEIDGMKVGVSVVRAVGFPPEDPYTVDDALPVLEGKLDDILQSSVNVAPADAWVKQILSVIAYSDEHAQSIVDAWALLDDTTRADTIVMVTVTDGVDDFVYFAQ